MICSRFCVKMSWLPFLFCAESKSNAVLIAGLLRHVDWYSSKVRIWSWFQGNVAYHEKQTKLDANDGFCSWTPWSLH